MPFPGARRKLDEARSLAEQLERATDAPTFRTIFSAFLSAAKATFDSLRKDGAKHPGFRQWHDGKRTAMKNDDLMRFVLDARDEDLHEGRHRLLFSTHLEHFDTGKAEPPPGGYPATIVFGREGPTYVVDERKPTERRVPIHTGGSWTTSVQIYNAPNKHRGKSLAASDPLSLCGAAIAYLGELVHEAETRFS